MRGRGWSPLRVPEDGSLEYWKERERGMGSEGVPWKDVGAIQLPTEIGLASTNPSYATKRTRKSGSRATRGSGKSLTMTGRTAT